jgi:membrane fusion protein, multidrug efflux system
VALLLGAISLQLTSCGRSSAGAAEPTAPEVEVVPVEQRDIPVYREWIGTLDGVVNAAIRAQVTGYLLTQDYSEGSFVKKGQLLFQIDPRSLQAAADQAQGQLAQAKGQLAQAQAQYQQSEAQLASAEANQRKAQFDEDRYTPLAREHAVTQQDLDNTVQNNISAKAQMKVVMSQVEAAKAQIQAASAAVEAANLNLGFTKLYSPIDGIAGNAQIQIGTDARSTRVPAPLRPRDCSRIRATFCAPDSTARCALPLKHSMAPCLFLSKPFRSCREAIKWPPWTVTTL